jgi:hypothetical protein
MYACRHAQPVRTVSEIEAGVKATPGDEEVALPILFVCKQVRGGLQR